MVGCGFLGVAIERFAYRPLRRAPRIAPLISALGVSFFLQNSVLLLFGADFRSYDTFDLGRLRGRRRLGPLTRLADPDRGGRAAVRHDARSLAARHADPAREGDARHSFRP